MNERQHSRRSHLGDDRRERGGWDARSCDDYDSKPGLRKLEEVLGDVTDWLIEWDRQHRGAISVSGDTVLFEELQEIPRRYHLRNALLHFGAAPFDVFGPAYHTFTAAERARFAKTLGETIVIPLHFEGWAHFTEGRT